MDSNTGEKRPRSQSLDILGDVKVVKKTKTGKN